jgi:hypothetical protein
MEQLFWDWEVFRDEFSQYDHKAMSSTEGPTIGHVKYNLYVDRADGTNEALLRQLNNGIQLEQFVGDRLLRFDCGLLEPFLSMSHIERLLPMLRLSIRAEIQQETAIVICRYGLSKGDGLSLMSQTNPTMVECVSYSRAANTLEMQLLQDSTGYQAADLQHVRKYSYDPITSRHS